MCRFSAGTRPCAESRGKEREQLTVLVGQERAVASFGWALDLGGRRPRATRGDGATLPCTRLHISVSVSYTNEAVEASFFSFARQ